MTVWTALIIALGAGLIAFTVAFGFIQVSEHDWMVRYRTMGPALLGLGIGSGLGLMFIGIASSRI